MFLFLIYFHFKLFGESGINTRFKETCFYYVIVGEVLNWQQKLVLSYLVLIF